MKKASLLLAFGLAHLSALVGCDGPDACEDTPYESHCEGNVRWSCLPMNDGEDFKWSQLPCDGACATVRDGLAVCALDAEPDTFCPNDGWHRVCVGSTLNVCTYGYVEAEEDCGAAELCNAEVPHCVLNPEPYPACPEQGSTHVCEGDTRIDCYEGYATGSEDCGPDRCHLSSKNGSGTCVLDDAPDARCSSLIEQGLDQVSVCDGNTLVACVDEFAWKIEDCGAKSCVHPSGWYSPECR